MIYSFFSSCLYFQRALSPRHLSNIIKVRNASKDLLCSVHNERNLLCIWCIGNVILKPKSYPCHFERSLQMSVYLLCQCSSSSLYGESRSNLCRWPANWIVLAVAPLFFHPCVIFSFKTSPFLHMATKWKVHSTQRNIRPSSEMTTMQIVQNFINVSFVINNLQVGSLLIP